VPHNTNPEADINIVI